MKYILIISLAILINANSANAQTDLKKIYDEEINPLVQIDEAIKKACNEGKFVACQVGGNWCPWCLRFANFITTDSTINSLISENFEYIHVNYNPRRSGNTEKNEQAEKLMKRLNNAGRFGFPVIVILDKKGNTIHIQDSSLLEEGKGYDREKVIRFFKNWTPSATLGKDK